MPFTNVIKALVQDIKTINLCQVVFNSYGRFGWLFSESIDEQLLLANYKKKSNPECEFRKEKVNYGASIAKGVLLFADAQKQVKPIQQKQIFLFLLLNERSETIEQAKTLLVAVTATSYGINFTD